ncbi:hypothetical protein [Brachybacterium sp. GPGPB12]|uniref:hypothetical protein n=1 Tax=Brachybacterium sp. GPGPB12 TaxID=3023517 RepID=UPI0031342CDA
MPTPRPLLPPRRRIRTRTSRWTTSAPRSRRRCPQRPDGRLITLTQLTARRAAPLVFVTEGCGPCERVLDHAEEWIGELEQTPQVRFVFSRPLDQPRERTTDRVTDHALHDLQFTARTALGGASAPSAVLLGADGQLAGGPVNGGAAR